MRAEDFVREVCGLARKFLREKALAAPHSAHRYVSVNGYNGTKRCRIRLNEAGNGLFVCVGEILVEYDACVLLDRDGVDKLCEGLRGMKEGMKNA
jgi:hypothetical protein